MSHLQLLSPPASENALSNLQLNALAIHPQQHLPLHRCYPSTFIRPLKQTHLYLPIPRLRTQFLHLISMESVDIRQNQRINPIIRFNHLAGFQLGLLRSIVFPQVFQNLNFPSFLVPKSYINDACGTMHIG